VAKHGKLVGELDCIADNAVRAWEEFMQRYARIQRSPDGGPA